MNGLFRDLTSLLEKAGGAEKLAVRLFIQRFSLPSRDDIARPERRMFWRVHLQYVSSSTCDQIVHLGKKRFDEVGVL